MLVRRKSKNVDHRPSKCRMCYFCCCGKLVDGEQRTNSIRQIRSAAVPQAPRLSHLSAPGKLRARQHSFRQLIFSSSEEKLLCESVVLNRKSKCQQVKILDWKFELENLKNLVKNRNKDKSKSAIGSFTCIWGLPETTNGLYNNWSFRSFYRIIKAIAKCLFGSLRRCRLRRVLDIRRSLPLNYSKSP